MRANIEKVVTKRLIAFTDNKEVCKIFYRDNQEPVMNIKFYRNSNNALNGAFLKKVMNAIEAYMRESDKNLNDY